MGIIQRKDKMTEAVSGENIFVPAIDDFTQDPPKTTKAAQEQFPPMLAQPKISVGIMVAHEIRFRFFGDFRCRQTERVFSGEQVAEFSAGKILFDGENHAEILFEPLDETHAIFELQNVTIGVDFHWERKENQQFKGALKLIVENEKLTAVNLIGVEDYLFSVISSEMSATASLEFLKAHAVISRSWLMQPIFEKNLSVHHQQTVEREGEFLRWYERDAHVNFDVCADDHCQRYQGLTRAKTDLVRQAVEQTRGEVLMSDGRICDARFSKSCGGISERFEACWADEPHNYLQPMRDDDSDEIPDLSQESEAEMWIRSAPKSYCNTHDSAILSQVLNHYDQETTDFYRWQVRYSCAELSELICRKSGIDFGEICDLIPVERGASGRLIRLKIVGTKREIVVGKELEIRKWLSPSHLYSSAFVVDKDSEGNFTLVGAGWGHGVGLCQIGAAVMGAKGFRYDQILQHYFAHSELKKMW